MNNRLNNNLAAGNASAAGNRAALDADAFVAALLQQQPSQPNRAASQAAAGSANLMGSGTVPARQSATRGRGASTRGGLSRQQQPAGTGLSPLGSQQLTNAPSLQAASLPSQSQSQQPQRPAGAASRGRSAGRGTAQRPGASAPAQVTNQQAVLASLLGVGAAPAAAGAAPVALPRQSAGARRSRAAGTVGAAANAGMTGNLLGQQGRGQQQQQRQALPLLPQTANAGVPDNNNPLAMFGQQGTLNQSQQRATRRPRSSAASAQNQPASLGAVNFAYDMADDGNNLVDDAANSKNKYLLVDREGYRQGPKYVSNGAYGAALKAATAGHTDIYLWDRNHKAAPGGRVYSYVGGSAPITNPSEFTMKHGITTKPMVKSRGYVDLDANYAPMERR